MIPGWEHGFLQIVLYVLDVPLLRLSLQIRCTRFPLETVE